MPRKKQRKQEENQTFGNRLRTAMGDMSVYKLAQTTGLSHTILHKYLQDVSTPGVDKVDELTKALNVSFLWLAKGNGSMRPKKKSNPDILAPENLKKIEVDLYTVVSAVEDLARRSKKQNVEISPETLAQDVALRCMRIPGH